MDLLAQCAREDRRLRGECPTGVLAFGRLTKPLDGERTLRVLDRLRASPVRMREAGKR